jgi:hypothetical protein
MSAFYLVERCWVVLARVMSMFSCAPSLAGEADNDGGGRQWNSGTKAQDHPYQQSFQHVRFSTFSDVSRPYGAPNSG